MTEFDQVETVTKDKNLCLTGRASQQANADRYLWSVTPCLMAWPAVMMQPGPASLVVGSTLGVAYMVDRSFAQRGLMPSW